MTFHPEKKPGISHRSHLVPIPATLCVKGREQKGAREKVRKMASKEEKEQSTKREKYKTG